MSEKGFWVWVPKNAPSNGGTGCLIVFLIILILIVSSLRPTFEFKIQKRDGKWEQTYQVKYSKWFFSDSIFGTFNYTNQALYENERYSYESYKIETSIRGKLIGDKCIFELKDKKIRYSEDLTYEQNYNNPCEFNLINDTTLNINGINCFGGWSFLGTTDYDW